MAQSGLPLILFREKGGIFKIDEINIVMRYKHDRENAYRKAATVCKEKTGVDIINNSTPAFFYGAFCKTLIKNPAEYGLPSMLGVNRSTYRIWKYKTIVLEVCDTFWGYSMHPNCSVAKRWPIFIGVPRVGLIAAGYKPSIVFNARLQDRVKLTDKEYTELLDEINFGRIKVTIHDIMWNPSSFLVWKHVPLIDTYYHPRSRKIINYIERHKDWFNKDNNHQRIDEIFDDDITDIKLKPDHLFNRIDERRNPKVNFPKFPYSLIDGIEYIDDSKKLAAEGRRMCHCVGNYSNACRAGNIFILRLPKSTVEINASGNVNQHRGMQNSVPPIEDTDLLRKWKHERRRVVEKTATELLEEQQMENRVDRYIERFA